VAEKLEVRDGANGRHAADPVAPVDPLRPVAADDTPVAAQAVAHATGTALEARNLGVRYNMRFTKKTKLRTQFSNLLRRDDSNRGTFWALQDVSFQLQRGESLGVIGPNGAGKSTLLLVLAGIITPSAGVVEANGHISTLLSLSAGFDADLTGRENIALAGALMGIEHKVMEAIQDDVIEFADVGAFIDAPLKTYSSGMRARLGFSIATAVNPDILLLDEVLQTGDEVFREKSRQRIIEVLKSAKAVVLVTHDMSWVTQFCTRAMLLENGNIAAQGNPAEVVATHMEHSALRKAERTERIAAKARGEIPVTSLKAAIAREKGQRR
jgi:ABC-type polysaccharide/polyol phosphate transport system ATPase subunit